MTKPGPTTLAVDIGGTSLKASLLDREGVMLVEPTSVATEYPCHPEGLIAAVRQLADRVPTFDRVSVGFPGTIRQGTVRSAPHFVKPGPGSQVTPDLQVAWVGFALAQALQRALDVPTRVLNDADLQALAVVTGSGLELTITLGTGFGTSLFYEGRLAPHLEFATHPLTSGQTYNEQVGDAAFKRVGVQEWNLRVALVIETLFNLMFYDRLYIGGGNARHVRLTLGPEATVIDNSAGILGGLKLWNEPPLWGL